VPDREDVTQHLDDVRQRNRLGLLSLTERARWERHLSTCASCLAEDQAARFFETQTAPGPRDAALDRAAVDAALTRLRQPTAWSEKMRRLFLPAAAVLTLSAAGMALVALAHAPKKAAVSVSRAPASRATTVLLTDGSEIAPDDPTTTVDIEEQTATRILVHLPSGGAKFRVRHDVRRHFQVSAGPVDIEDLGTVFRVEHTDGGRVRVMVSEGRVAVLRRGTQTRVELAAGQERTFSPLGREETAVDPGPAASTRVETPSLAESARVPARPAGRARPTDDAAALLSAADDARRARRPRDAVGPLRTLVEHYPHDPRAPAAAFTLGWLFLTDLDRPREAAAAFRDAERLSPPGALAEDAAARVAEAWKKAGDGTRAAEAALHYRKAYPKGRYLALMQGFVDAR